MEKGNNSTVVNEKTIDSARGFRFNFSFSGDSTFDPIRHNHRQTFFRYNNDKLKTLVLCEALI
jgi:hypothetical protein